MKNTSFYEICMFLYNEMGDFESEELENIETLKQDVNKSLRNLNQKLHDIFEFDEAENIMELAIDYAEKYAKQHFVHGMEHGIILCKEINNVRNTF